MVKKLLHESSIDFLPIEEALELYKILELESIVATLPRMNFAEGRKMLEVGQFVCYLNTSRPVSTGLRMTCNVHTEDELMRWFMTVWMVHPEEFITRVLGKESKRRIKDDYELITDIGVFPVAFVDIRAAAQDWKEQNGLLLMFVREFGYDLVEKAVDIYKKGLDLKDSLLRSSSDRRSVRFYTAAPVTPEKELSYFIYLAANMDKKGAFNIPCKTPLSMKLCKLMRLTVVPEARYDSTLFDNTESAKLRLAMEMNHFGLSSRNKIKTERLNPFGLGRGDLDVDDDLQRIPKEIWEKWKQRDRHLFDNIMPKRVLRFKMEHEMAVVTKEPGKQMACRATPGMQDLAVKFLALPIFRVLPDFVTVGRMGRTDSKLVFVFEKWKFVERKLQGS
jgi:hypothetical protein